MAADSEREAVLRIPLVKWAASGSVVLRDDPVGSSSAAGIDPMLRRRLSPLARAALQVASACAEQAAMPMVYASRHGELGRTVELLLNLARGEALSPTTFSLSVLNSAAGVYAISRGDPAPATAVSAGRESFGFGLLEACARARRIPGPLLYLYADTRAPTPLGPLPNDPDAPLAVAMVLDQTVAASLEMDMVWAPGSPDDGPQAEGCLAVLASPVSSPVPEGVWHSGQRFWRWRKLDGPRP